MECPDGSKVQLPKCGTTLGITDPTCVLVRSTKMLDCRARLLNPKDIKGGARQVGVVTMIGFAAAILLTLGLWTLVKDTPAARGAGALARGAIARGSGLPAGE
jgi:hypothetical protein